MTPKLVEPIRTKQKRDRQRQESKNKQKRPKNKRQTSEEVFGFESTFIPYEWTFTRKMRYILRKQCVTVFNDSLRLVHTIQQGQRMMQVMEVVTLL